MMRCLAIALLVACGSTSVAPPTNSVTKPSCDNAGAILRGSLAELAGRTKEKLVARECETGEWSQEVLDCIVRDAKPSSCLRKLTEAQAAAYRQQICAWHDTFPDVPDDVGCSRVQLSASLYDRLGGKDAIVAIVDDFVTNLAGDVRINQFFANVDIAVLKRNLVDQLCEMTGGPCHYRGHDMKTAHAGMGIKQPEFDAFIADLARSLRKFHVPDREQAELLGALGSMQSDMTP